MSDEDLSYYRHRAEIELDLAQRATCAEAILAQDTLAEAYLERILSSELAKRVEHA